MTAAAHGPTLPHGYGTSIAAVAAPAPSPVDMPRAKCGKVTGLYRCCRKAGHGGNCTPTRRDDIDLGEEFGQVAPDAPVPDLVRGPATPLTIPTPAEVAWANSPSASARSSTPYGLADQLDIAAKALRWSGSKHLGVAERGHAAALATSIVMRVGVDLAPPRIQTDPPPTSS